jgi:hypothetical protein
MQVNSLPDFRLFTVFFVVPGALLVLLAGCGPVRKHAARPDRLPSPTRPRHARPETEVGGPAAEAPTRRRPVRPRVLASAPVAEIFEPGNR